MKYPSTQSTTAMVAIVVGLILMVLLEISDAHAASWRDFRSQCGNNIACAKEQAKAHSLWTSQNWDRDLKETCRAHIESSYMRNRNYVKAVNCVYALQVSRQRYTSRQESIKTNRALQKSLNRRPYYYRR